MNVRHSNLHFRFPIFILNVIRHGEDTIRECQTTYLVQCRAHPKNWNHSTIFLLSISKLVETYYQSLHWKFKIRIGISGKNLNSSLYVCTNWEEFWMMQNNVMLVIYHATLYLCFLVFPCKWTYSWRITV